MQADAMNGHTTVMWALNHHPHITEGLNGRQGILTFQETFHLGSTLSE